LFGYFHLNAKTLVAKTKQYLLGIVVVIEVLTNGKNIFESKLGTPSYGKLQGRSQYARALFTAWCGARLF
jgi:hypothetical protein